MKKDYMNGFFIAQFPWIAWMAAITIQSSFKGMPIPDLGVTFSDKILHFLVFGFLGLLITRGMRYSKVKIFKTRPMLMAIILGCIFALSDEIHQSFVPARSAEVLDWVADFLGIVFFSYLYSVWCKRKQALVTERQSL